MSAHQQQSGSSQLPAITLAVLVAMIIALLYIGYEKLADTTGNTDELTNIPIDSVQRNLSLEGEPELIAPVDTLVDTTATPAPVDLSQETPPAEAAPEETKPAAEGEETKTAASETKPPVEEKPKPEEKKPDIPKGGLTTTYTVGDGETFYGIANRLNMKVSTLKAMNPNVSEESVKAGVTRLNVKARAVHTVGPGDVLRVVAEKYGISKEALMRANGKTKDFAQRGEKLIIPYADRQ
nr:LysM peptidoglycan-binding domain-containing protein [uncultured Arsenicibacter sp.]